MKGFQPLEVVHVDLEQGLGSLAGHASTGERGLYAVLWLCGIPLGHVEVDRAQLRHAPTLAHLVASSIAAGVGHRLDLPGFEGVPRDLDGSMLASTPDLATLSHLEAPLAMLRRLLDAHNPSNEGLRVSVVICTRGRPDQLLRCLESLAGVSPAPHEVIVVDNDPDIPFTRAVVEQTPDVVYVAEATPGLSRARNAGLRRATGDVIAFADDDTTLHRDWIRRLSEAFDDPQVMAVTGLVIPAELDTPAQIFFEKGMGGFGQGYRRISFDRSFLQRTQHHGAPVWRIGAGANMAIRREAFGDVGDFDERLGAGASGCSEDSEFWYRLLARGWQIRYEPSAVVFHYHREDVASLRMQARDYIRGHVAALFVQYRRWGHTGNLRRALIDLPHYLARRSLRHPIFSNKESRVVRSYVAGYMRGLAYLPLAFSDRSPRLSFRRQRLVSPPSRSGKVELAAFLRSNPYPHALTEGLFYREKMSAIHRVAPEGRFERILEVGGGQSGLTSALYCDAEVINVDIDVEYARSPLNRHPTVRFIAGDATRLPFADASFDVVTLFDVLEHIARDDLAASEVRRVLRPGGFALVTTPNERWRFPYYRALESICPSEACIMAQWGHVRRGYSSSQLQELFGAPPARVVSFFTPITVIGNDLAFSRLPGKARRLACAAVSPLTWAGMALHRLDKRGTETAACWRLDRG